MLTGLPWRPIITYGSSPTTIALTLPQKLWGYDTQLQGDSSIFSTGNLIGYVFREDNRAKLTLRVRDCVEYLDVRAWIMDAMLGNTFTFQFDADDATSAFTCRLDTPAFKDGFKPRRMAEWPDVWEVEVMIRATNGIPIFYSIAQNCDIDTTFVEPIDWIISQLDASALPYGAGRKILSMSPVAPIFPPDGIGDTTPDAGFTPAGFPSFPVLYTSIDPIQEWISRPLSAGFVIPSYGVIGGSTSGSPAMDWFLQDALLFLHHLRGGSIIASSSGVVASFGWLGGGNYVPFLVSSIGALTFRDDDQFLLQAFSRYMPRPDGDASGRLGLSWGSVFGPLTTTRMYGVGNVRELP